MPQFDICSAVAQFRRDGYMCLEGVFTSAQVETYRSLRSIAAADWRCVHETDSTPEFIADILERFPRLGIEAAAHLALLGFAEALMGPMVQLDSMVLAAAKPVDRSRLGEPVQWHRDRFGFLPNGTYTRPLALVYFVYLQRMTASAGPLRVIPGSHRDPVMIAPEVLTAPHTAERLLHTNPGDVVVVHHNLLHSGTRSVDPDDRLFLGLCYTLTCLRAEETRKGPNCQALIATARRTHNRRMLRLLGADDRITERQNSGFTQPPEEEWAVWRSEDDAYAASAPVPPVH